MKDKFIAEDPNQEYSNEVQDQIQRDIESLNLGDLYFLDENGNPVD